MNKFNGKTYGIFHLPVRKMKKIYLQGFIPCGKFQRGIHS